MAKEGKTKKEEVKKEKEVKVDTVIRAGGGITVNNNSTSRRYQ
jgi:hypothetical protein|tara:strand:+ start:236 stop:364 length:129 start_codon:yes stop_codon:yes gene_type:complete